MGRSVRFGELEGRDLLYLSGETNSNALGGETAYGGFPWPKPPRPQSRAAGSLAHPFLRKGEAMFALRQTPSPSRNALFYSRKKTKRQKEIPHFRRPLFKGVKFYDTFERKASLCSKFFLCVFYQMGALRGYASVCRRQTSPRTSAGGGVPEDACLSRLQARGNRAMRGSPTRAVTFILLNPNQL
jgi:hypothetical protein